MTIDLTTVTEVDPNNRLSSTTTTSTFTGLTGAEVAYQYIDYGAAFFSGSAYLESDFTISSSSGTATVKELCVGFADGLNDGLSTVNEAGLLILFGTGAATTFDPRAFKRESSVTGTAVSTSTSLAKATIYYTRIGFYSSLGHFGAIVVQFFSDSGRTIQVSVAILQRTAARTYRYFYPIQGANNALADSLTGTNANITIYQPVAGLDQTTFTEVDPSSHFVEYADVTTATTLSCNETAYVYKDYTASYFNGNYTFQSVLNVTAVATGTVQQRANLLSLVNTLGHANLTNDLQGIALSFVSGITFSLKAREVNGAVEYLSTASTTLNFNNPYWIQINRDVSVGTYGTIYVKIFSDPLYVNQIGSTLSLTLHASVSFRYLNSIQSYNNAQTCTLTFTNGGIVSNVSTSSSQTEAVTSSDAVSASQDAAPTQAESVTSADSQNATSSGAVTVDIAEAVTAADVQTGALVGATDIIDTLAALDSVVVSVVDAVSVNETLVLNTTINAILSGLPVLSPRFWRIKKWDAVSGKYIPATGLTPLYYLVRPSDMLWLDLFDGVFRSFGGCSLPKDTMTEDTNIPGLYKYVLQSEQFSLNDQYYEFGEYYGMANYFAEAVVLYVDGVEQIAGINGTMSVDGIQLMQKTRMEMAVLPIGDATVPNGPGSFSFKGQDGRVRVAGSVDASGVRTVTTKDGTK
jgi:hypothetical protein